MRIYALIFALGGIFGLILSQILFKPKVEWKEVITRRSDTVYVALPKDTVYLTKNQIKHTYLRDTILVNDFKPQIKAFKATYPLTYGNVYANGEVLGEVTKIAFSNDLKIPVVTNTIREEKIKTIHTKGLYLGAGVGMVGDQATLGELSASYVMPKSIIRYSYNTNKVHGFSYSLKIF
jgi:hypothetical protein